MKFLDATGITHLWGRISGAFQAKVTASGILKGDGEGGVTSATAGTDYQAAIAASGILKGDGEGGVSSAAAGTDYQAPLTNPVTGSGSNGYLAKFDGEHSVENGPQLGSGTTTYLRNDGSWAVPPDTTTGTTYLAENVPANTDFGTNGSIKNVFDAMKRTTATASLTVAGWSASNEQTVTVSGVTSSNLVIVSPAPSSWAEASAAGVYCLAQGSGSLTFKSASRPSAAITVNVVIMS